MNAIGSMEVGATCEEPNVLELDEYAEELHNMLDNISGLPLDLELWSALGKVLDRFHESVGGVPQATNELGNGHRSLCHPNEASRREQRGCQWDRSSA